ncbi:class A beta-lactamase [Nonomuraea longicatena]|uniref:PEN family class A beta-lactamase, Bpc-type n=1 Tax=Nonomuraea longicatena TaxID=83682 RepID=A0ABN1Q339_9ACTN
MRFRHIRSGLALAAALLIGGSLGTGTAVAAPADRVGKEMRALEESFDGRIGAYAIDTATGKSVGHRAGELFPLLSTFKAPVCAAALHRARTAEPGLMSKRVKWTEADLKPHSPVTEKHMDDGLTVSELCEATITVSDNTAGNMVLKQIGGPAGMTRYFRTLKDPVSRLDRWETELNDWKPGDRRDTTSPAAITRDLRALSAGDALHPQDRRRFNDWLVASETGGERIRAGLPKSWKVGDKTGTNGEIGAANDIAVIWPGKSAEPIVMAVYTHRGRPPVDDTVLAKAATILAKGLGRL